MTIESLGIIQRARELQKDSLECYEMQVLEGRYLCDEPLTFEEALRIVCGEREE